MEEMPLIEQLFFGILFSSLAIKIIHSLEPFKPELFVLRDKMEKLGERPSYDRKREIELLRLFDKFSNELKWVKIPRLVIDTVDIVNNHINNYFDKTCEFPSKEFLEKLYNLNDDLCESLGERGLRNYIGTVKGYKTLIGLEPELDILYKDVHHEEKGYPLGIW